MRTQPVAGAQSGVDQCRVRQYHTPMHCLAVGPSGTTLVAVATEGVTRRGMRS
jgi:hypothetical protein